MEPVQKATTSINAENSWLRYSIPVDTPITQPPHLRFKEHGGGGGRKNVRIRRQGSCWKIMSSRSDREVTAMKSQEHDCLNKTCTIQHELISQSG